MGEVIKLRPEAEEITCPECSCTWLDLTVQVDRATGEVVSWAMRAKCHECGAEVSIHPTGSSNGGRRIEADDWWSDDAELRRFVAELREQGEQLMGEPVAHRLMRDAADLIEDVTRRATQS